MAAREALYGASLERHEESPTELHQLFSIKNESGTPEDFQRNLTTVASRIKSFNIFHSVDSLKEASVELVKYNVKDIVSLVKADEVFIGDKPSWEASHLPPARDAALHIFNFLKDAKDQIIKLDVDKDVSSPSKRQLGDTSEKKRSVEKDIHPLPRQARRARAEVRQTGRTNRRPAARGARVEDRRLLSVLLRRGR